LPYPLGGLSQFLGVLWFALGLDLPRRAQMEQLQIPTKEFDGAVEREAHAPCQHGINFVVVEPAHDRIEISGLPLLA
jgi:hypothetical protein